MKRKHKPVQQDPIANELAEILSQPVPTPEAVPTPMPEPTPVPAPTPEPVPLEVLVVEADYLTTVLEPSPMPEPEPTPAPVLTPEVVPTPVSEAVPELASEPVPNPVPELVPESLHGLVLLVEGLQKQVLAMQEELDRLNGDLGRAIITSVTDGMMELQSELKEEFKKELKIAVGKIVLDKIKKYHKNPYAINNPDF